MSTLTSPDTEEIADTLVVTLLILETKPVAVDTPFIEEVGLFTTEISPAVTVLIPLTEAETERKRTAVDVIVDIPATELVALPLTIAIDVCCALPETDEVANAITVTFAVDVETPEILTDACAITGLLVEAVHDPATEAVASTMTPAPAAAIGDWLNAEADKDIYITY